MPQSNPSVDIKDLHLTLGSDAGPVHILRGIDLQINQGERIGLVGPSGSGKSSLMLTLGGLQKPTSGRISIKGADITDWDEDRLARFRRDHIGIVFQNFHLVPTMTALENTAIPLEFSGRDNAFDLAKDALEAVGLDHRLSHYPGQLSGGEQQRVALARAIVAKPELILADEPTGNLDGTTGQKIIDLLFELCADSGSTLLLITHDTALAQSCDRVVEMIDGTIKSSGKKAHKAA